MCFQFRNGAQRAETGSSMEITTKTITVEKDREYAAREDDVYNERTYFASVYRQAVSCLKSVLKYSVKLDSGNSILEDRTGLCQQESESLLRLSDARLNSMLLNRPSNIMSFCADRGQGKTTAMVSFAKALRNAHLAKSMEKEAFWGNQIPGYCFDVINSIDPTGMEEHDSIIKMVLSRMFSRFREKCECLDCAHTDTLAMENRRDELAMQFQKCFHDLGVLHSGKSMQSMDMEDELERIAELGDSSNFRASLYRLIREYLEFVRTSDKQPILVLQIDDADLNVDKVYDILEDIRKYLHLPCVVILMAANMQMLEATVEQHFLKEYEESLQEKGSMVNAERCHDIAERYLEKVLPKPMRIYLPDLDFDGSAFHENGSGIQVCYLDNNTDRLSHENAKKDWCYQKQLLHFLHRKTGMIFLMPTTYLHNLLPTTMRELTHFLAYFDPLEDVTLSYAKIIDHRVEGTMDAIHEEMVRWRSNLERLERYLGHLWSSVNLRREGRQHLQMLMAQPPEHKHRYLLHILPGYYARERIERDRSGENSEQKYRDQFIDECKKRGVFLDDVPVGKRVDGVPVYGSYADVITVLNVLINLPGGSRQFKFAYAVAFYFSIFAHELLLDELLLDSRSGMREMPDLFGDILFRNGVQGSMDQSLAFWHIPIKTEILKAQFRGRGQQHLNALNRNLRMEREDSLYFTTRPVSIQADKQGNESPAAEQRATDEKPNELFDPSAEQLTLNELSGKTLIFNPFYCLWFELRKLLYGFSEMERESYLEEKWNRERSEIALVVLLNWDVQKELLHQFKQSKPQQDDLSLSDAMHGIMTKICRLNLDEINGLRFEDMADGKLFVDDTLTRQSYELLQLCMPGQFDRQLTNYIQIAEEQIDRLNYLASYRNETMPDQVIAEVQAGVNNLIDSSEILEKMEDSMRNPAKFRTLRKKMAAYHGVSGQGEDGWSSLSGEFFKAWSSNLDVNTATASIARTARDVIRDYKNLLEKYQVDLRAREQEVVPQNLNSDSKGSEKEHLEEQVLRMALDVLELHRNSLLNQL